MDLPTDAAARVKLFDELAETQPELMRAFIERHPRNLMAYLGLSVEDFHQDALGDFLEVPRTFWLAPRGSGKSTAALMFCIWVAISDPESHDPSIPVLFPGALSPIGPDNIRIALTGNSAEKAEELLDQAKRVLTDDRMVKLFGIMQGRRWSNNKADSAMRTDRTKREATFTAMGLGSKVTGGHYDLVLADDYVTLDNSITEGQRQKIAAFWNFTVKPTHEPWARTIGCGTRYHPNDWYQVVKGWADDRQWNLRLTPAITGKEGEEVSYWPDVFSMEVLRAIKQEIGPVAFATQYQNQVDLLLGEFFESSWVERHQKWEELPLASRNKAVTVIALDPSIKAGLRNDFSVFVVLSYIAPYFYVRNVVRGQWTQEEILQRAKFLARAYEPREFGVEVVGGVEFLVQSMKKMPELRKVQSMRPTATRGKSKEGRAAEVRRFFEKELVFFEPPTEENGIQRLIEEMMAFPTAHNVPGMDDCVDSLVWSMLLMARQSTRRGGTRAGRSRR